MPKYKPPTQMRVLSVNLRVDISVAERCQRIAKEVFPFDEKYQKWNQVALLLLEAELTKWEEAKRYTKESTLRQRMKSVAVSQLAERKILTVRVLTRMFPGQRDMARKVLAGLVKDGLLEEFSNGQFRRAPRTERFTPDPLIVALGVGGADCGLDRATDGFDSVFGGSLFGVDLEDGDPGPGEDGPSGAENGGGLDDSWMAGQGHADTASSGRTGDAPWTESDGGRHRGTIWDFVRESRRRGGGIEAGDEPAKDGSKGRAGGVDPENEDLPF
jgi:hypothetical protein